MPYPETKVYFDGSHYIAIPHTTRPSKKRTKPKEEEITVTEEIPERESAPEQSTSTVSVETERQSESAQTADGSSNVVTENGATETSVSESRKPNTKTYTTTRKELFDKLYREAMNLPARSRRKAIIEGMRSFFKTEKAAADYVTVHLERKRRNLIARRIRCTRKANLAGFNYFVTFTYDGEIHTEETFRKQLKNCLRNFSYRKQWRYLGVWERSPEKKRLHFHGLFRIPDGTMPGELFEKNDYSFNIHKRQVTIQNTYFNERFGRSDFEEIDDNRKLGNAMAYILKYIEKTGERIVYSKGLPQYFLSDVMDEDVVCPIGIEDKKLLLYDDFSCWDAGELIGKVSADTIRKLRSAN